MGFMGCHSSQISYYKLRIIRIQLSDNPYPSDIANTKSASAHNRIRIIHIRMDIKNFSPNSYNSDSDDQMRKLSTQVGKGIQKHIYNRMRFIPLLRRSSRSSHSGSSHSGEQFARLLGGDALYLYSSLGGGSWPWVVTVVFRALPSSVWVWRRCCCGRRASGAGGGDSTVRWRRRLRTSDLHQDPPSSTSSTRVQP
jgi:hypothetical protein